MDKNKRVLRIAQVVGTIFTLIAFLDLPVVGIILPIALLTVGVNTKLQYWNNQREYVIKVFIRGIVSIILWILLVIVVKYFNIKILIASLLDYIT